MATLQISFDQEQLSVLADYYKAEKKKLQQQLEGINVIIAKIEGRATKSTKTSEVKSEGAAKGRRGRPKGATAKKPRAKRATSGKRGRPAKVATTPAETPVMEATATPESN